MTTAERDRKVDELRAIEARLRALGEHYCALQVRRSVAVLYAITSGADVRALVREHRPRPARAPRPSAWERAIDEQRLAGAQSQGEVHVA